MSNISIQSEYDIQQLSSIVLVMDRYMIIIIYITGISGAILNVITFLHKRIRRSASSVYFLSTSVIDFAIMNVAILLNIITTYYPTLSTLFYSTGLWCKLGNYSIFVFTCTSSSYSILISFDRLCASSLNATFRKWSQFTVSWIMVIIVFFIWVLFGLHISIAYDYSKDISTGVSACYVQKDSAIAFIVIDGFLFSLFNGAIAPFILCIIGLVIYHNIRQSQRRVAQQPQNNNNISRQNHHMLIMVLVQVFLTIILHIPYTVIYLMGYFQKLSTNPLSIYLFIIFDFIARWFYLINYCKTFYINTLTSTFFRKFLREQLIKCFRYN